MAAQGYVYTNHNGRESLRQLSSNEIENMVCSSFEDLFSPIFSGNIFSIPAVQNFITQQPPRTKRNSVSTDYPPSKKVMNELKRITWKIGLCGLGMDDVFVDLNDNIISVEVLHDAEPAEAVVVDYSNLHLPKKGDKISFKFNPTFYNPNSLKVDFKNGLMLISIDPREELKPVKKVLFGKKPEEPKPEEPKQEENTEPATPNDGAPAEDSSNNG